MAPSAPGAALALLGCAWRLAPAVGETGGATEWGDQGHCTGNTDQSEFSYDPNVDRAEVWVQAHNHYRACHGTGPLTWNPTLAGYARAWVEQLLRHCDGVQDMFSWVGCEGEGVHRPHDPHSYDENPSNGENIWSGQGFGMGGGVEISATESWYREVTGECPSRGRDYGCGGGMLNHYTAMVWKDARQIGCYVASKQTWMGPFIVASCRYSSGGTDMYGCDAPNTMGCAEQGPQPDGGQVPPLVHGECPHAVEGDDAAAPVPEAQTLAEPEVEAEPVPEPRPEAPPAAGPRCVQPGSLGKCENCLTHDQCGGGRFCCPYMKKCVKDGAEACFAPVAECNPPCHSDDPFECRCKFEGFPCSWAQWTCGAPALNCAGAGEQAAPPTAAPPLLPPFRQPPSRATQPPQSWPTFGQGRGSPFGYEEMRQNGMTLRVQMQPMNLGSFNFSGMHIGNFNMSSANLRALGLSDSALSVSIIQLAALSMACCFFGAVLRMFCCGIPIAPPIDEGYRSGMPLAHGDFGGRHRPPYMHMP